MRTFIDSGFVKNMWWTRYQRRKWKAKKTSCGWLQTCARLWWIYSNISCHVSWKGTAWWSIGAQSQFNQVCFDEVFFLLWNCIGECQARVKSYFEYSSNAWFKSWIVSFHGRWIWCWKLNLCFLFSCQFWSKLNLKVPQNAKLGNG